MAVNGVTSGAGHILKMVMVNLRGVQPRAETQVVSVAQVCTCVVTCSYVCICVYVYICVYNVRGLHNEARRKALFVQLTLNDVCKYEVGPGSLR